MKAINTQVLVVPLKYLKHKENQEVLALTAANDTSKQN